MSLLELRDIQKVYGRGEAAVVALKDVSLAIGAGEVVAITGPSGSGKSTLMNILGCLDSPTDGSYLLDDRDVARLDDDALALVRNRTIGFVFQSHNLLARKTAIENVMLPMLYAGIARAERRRRAEARLAELGLEKRMHHRPSELSGGQSQRVAIARALVTEPKLILADEPTGNVDSKTSQVILDLLLDINARSGVTLVIVTHDPRVAERAQRRIVIVDGELSEAA